MSGSTPSVAGATTTTGAVLLPNTGGSRFVFGVAVAALAIGLVVLAISGVASLKQRSDRA